MMTQAQAIPGLSIDTSFATGQLSLHEYRKFLSRQDNIKMSSGNPQRTLKRKQAAFNLSQAQVHTQYHDFAYNLQSPVSSAPSSPPPLSFSQSLVSLHGDLPTPISPISTSTSRPFSRPVSSNNSSVTRRLDPFSARLKKPKQYSRTHSRTSSDLTLPSTGGSLTLKIKHNGTDFEILNPRDSLFHYQGLSSYWSSEDIMEREDSPERISQSQSFMSPNSNPDDMVRPISASESAILSRRKKLPSPSPTMSGMLGASNSFAALPPVEEVPLPSTRAGPRSSKIPGRTLRQKVSRLFGGSAEATDPEKRASYHSPKLDTEAGRYDMKHPDTYHDEEMYTPSSEQWPEELTSMLPIHIGEQPDTRHASTQNSSQRNSEEEELKTIRRPNWGTHSTNRHHTLQDALQQLETENNGLTYDDIMRYIGTNSDSGHDQAAVVDNAPGHDEKGARPWQPDTWQEPTRHRMPHNRPSDSNLSTNAPSTRPSIRPYVERAAAFMAGDDRSSLSSSTSTIENNRHNSKDEHASNANQVVGISPASPEVKATTTTTSEPSTPPLTLRRTISLRARPLSSNPPDLDIPIIPASPPRKATTITNSPATITTITPTTPTALAPPRAGSRVSWGPEIPQRHPDHRMLQSAGSPSSSSPPKDASPQSQPRVVTNTTTTTTGPRKLRKKHASGCHCL